jgi:hypothetical protein
MGLKSAMSLWVERLDTQRGKRTAFVDMFRKFGNIFNYFRKEISDRMLGREIG